MTASDFKPSVKNCKNRGCGNLIWEIFEGRRRMICAVNDRIPGNLTECPLAATTEEDATLGGIMHNSISSYNTRRDITVTRFNDGIATAGRCDRGDYQEIISSIVKAARLNGYQIPEEEA